MKDEGGGVRVEGERLSVKEEGSGGELGSDLDLDLDPDPWKILWFRIHGKYYGSGSGKMMQNLWIRIRNSFRMYISTGIELHRIFRLI